MLTQQTCKSDLSIKLLAQLNYKVATQIFWNIKHFFKYLWLNRLIAQGVLKTEYISFKQIIKVMQKLVVKYGVIKCFKFNSL